MEIDDTIKGMMTEIFKTDVCALGTEISPRTIARWDSLAHITLMLALEKKFRIRIPDEQVVTLASFADIAAAVKRLAVA